MMNAICLGERYAPHVRSNVVLRRGTRGCLVAAECAQWRPCSIKRDPYFPIEASTSTDPRKRPEMRYSTVDGRPVHGGVNSARQCKAHTSLASQEHARPRVQSSSVSLGARDRVVVRSAFLEASINVAARRPAHWKHDTYRSTPY